MKDKRTILMLLLLVTGLILLQSAKAQEAQMVVPNSVFGNGGDVRVNGGNVAISS